MAAIEHLYIHVPFCTHICPYCAFHKHTGTGGKMRDFVDALLKELKWAQSEYDLRPTTVYFGGGTPSALGVPLLERLFEKWPFREVREFTFECNPATVSPQKATLLKQAGVNRISLGVQSFLPWKLSFLGRVHTPESVQETIDHLRTAGISSINVDLIFGLPGEGEELWKEDLRMALKTKPQHLSCYSLTVEEGTPFAQAGMKMNDDQQGAFFRVASEFLEEHGFSHYEISNYSLSGHESIHNLAYWRGKDYLGLGPGAVSTVGLRRWKNVEDTTRYLATLQQEGVSAHEVEILTPEIRMREKIFLSLRTNEGIPRRELLEWEGDISRLVEEGLAIEKEGRVILSRQGMVVADSISELFL